MTRRVVTLTVNGRTHALELEPWRLLLDVLRRELKLYGAREGCGAGVCGACTVLCDGRPVSSCIMLAIHADGCAITTIEGLARDGQLHPLQQAFLEHPAFQCGFCTPGMIMAAKALLDQNPAPSDEEIVEHMQGNLCRCTDYTGILAAVRAVRDHPGLASRGARSA
ncbi:MAG: (2Fe-2S)-binding protein [Deltaproteobacteria bacterium]|nr:(2Fe-2S)-binding protein [Deltaproteobacteria bacterium]MBI3077877.1 (2Fe-2S)-binding protein [Deltaproteobacteria bacterium]